MDQLLLVLISSATWAVAGWTLNTALFARRRQRLVAKEAATEAATVITATLAAMEARLGVRIAMTQYVALDPDEIRNGDRIRWTSDAGDEVIEYTAGYHGDAGNQTGGSFHRAEWEHGTAGDEDQ